MKPEPTTVDPHAETRLRLLDLASDASLYLRRSAEPSVRVAAALLLAASLAACSSSPSSTASSSSASAPAVPPLASEVKEGMPTAPGNYPLSSNSLSRDAQGTYGFSWRNPTGAASWNQGRASLMKLAQGTEDTLEIPQSGDPTLRLKPDTAITLPDDDAPVGGPTPTPRTSTSSTSSSSSSGNRSIAWFPFSTGGGTTASTSPSSTSADTVPATTPAYRNPPAAEPGQGSVRGASSSLSAPTSSARTWTSPSRAASTGQAGGPGGGTAATARSGAGTTTAQGASRPGSSLFSGGKSGSSASSSSSSSSG